MAPTMSPPLCATSMFSSPDEVHLLFVIVIVVWFVILNHHRDRAAGPPKQD